MALRRTGRIEHESLALGAGRQTGEAGNGVASVGTTAMFTGSHDLQIVNSTLSVARGDIHHHYHNHYHYEQQRDIWVTLQSVPNFRDIFLDMLEKATPGTGMWLIKGQKFRVWLEPNGDIKIFWGSGIPGAGKTVLVSIVIEYLEALRKESGGTICVCYFYFRYSQREEVTIRNILEVLVKQILERHPECQALIESTYAQHLRERSEPTATQLLTLLRELADCMTCTFYVLDALDEAPTKIQLAVVKTLVSLNVKLFITSRPLETVQTKFPGAYTISIFAQDVDLDLHIDKAIDESADLQHLLDQEGPSLKEEIISTIKQNCGGMFLHASLQLDALCECISAQQVTQTLKAFPSKIEDVYLYTWNRILQQNAEHVLIAKAVLFWVLNASRSLTVEELRRAVATSPETHEFQANRVVPSISLISLCRGLVTVEEESRLVRLVHYTAKDTLEGLLHESFPHPHPLLAAVCMTHLSGCGFQNTKISSEEEFRTALNNDPLLAYASEAWVFHACAALNVEETKHRIAQFVKESHAFPAFTGFGRAGHFDILTPIHITGLHKLPMALIGGEFIGDPNLMTPVHQQTPLIVASRSGHEDLVACLIALPETQVNLIDDSLWSALMQAARGGQEGVVKLLLAHPNIQVNLNTNNVGWSALMHAACAGHQGIVKLLLAHPEVRVNLVDDRGWSALTLAAAIGHEGVVKVLLAHPGIQVNFLQKNGWSTLMQAARAGFESVVELLLAYPGIQVDLRDNHHSTAFLVAAEYGHHAVVKLLLNTGAFDVNAFDKDGDTAIKIAASKGHEAIVRLLLDTPHVDITVRSTTYGHNAMSAARASGHSVIVELLRDFESRKPAVVSAWQIGQLSPHDVSDEQGSNSGSEDQYYDAEEGEDEEDVNFGS